MPSAKILVCARKKSILLTDYYLTMLITPQRLDIIIIIISRDSSVGIATRYGLDGPGIESRWLFRTHPGWPWCRPSFLFNRYWVFPGGKRPVRGVDGPPLLPPKLEEEHSCTFTSHMGLRDQYRVKFTLLLLLLLLLLFTSFHNALYIFHEFWSNYVTLVSNY